jgi:hypothetical protein
MSLVHNILCLDHSVSNSFGVFSVSMLSGFAVLNIIIYITCNKKLKINIIVE